MPLGRGCYLALVAVPVAAERVAAVLVVDILAVPVAVLVALAIVAADRLF